MEPSEKGDPIHKGTRAWIHPGLISFSSAAKSCCGQEGHAMGRCRCKDRVIVFSLVTAVIFWISFICVSQKIQKSVA